MNLDNLEWTCHACGQLRADRDILVWKEPIPLWPAEVGGEVRLRYCADRPSCQAGAEQMAVAFAHRLAWVGGEPPCRS